MTSLQVPLAGRIPRRPSKSPRGQFERFKPSKLSDRNGFVKETFAGIAAAAGNAPIPAVRVT